MPVRARKNPLLERLRKAHKALPREDFAAVSAYRLARKQRARYVAYALWQINSRKRRPAQMGAKS